MTAEQARAAVGDARRTLSVAMRALSVPGPDWGAAAGKLLDVAREAGDLALRCLDESEGDKHDD